MARNAICGQRYGTSFSAKRWYSVDVCGALGVSVSWSVHLFAVLVIATQQLVSESPVALTFYLLVYIPTAFLAMASLFQATHTNPGAVPLGARPLTTVRRNTATTTTTTTTTRTLRRCPKCHDNFKPPRAHHDSVTGRCIVKFDHYCPWINNAVGALNHKFFCLFVLYTALCCIQVWVLLVLRFLPCVLRDMESDHHDMHTKDDDDDDNASQQPSRWLLFYTDCTNEFMNNPYVLVLTCMSFVFFLFTCAMGCEQWEAIQTGQGKIARMKLRVGQQGTELHRVTEEFNEMFGTKHVTWQWFSPFHAVEFPRGMRPVVLGYEWDPMFPEEAYYPPEDEEQSEQHDRATSPASSLDTRNRRRMQSSSRSGSLEMV